MRPLASGASSVWIRGTKADGEKRFGTLVLTHQFEKLECLGSTSFQSCLLLKSTAAHDMQSSQAAPSWCLF
jgi:hypothetical protein